MNATFSPVLVDRYRSSSFPLRCRNHDIHSLTVFISALVPLSTGRKNRNGYNKTIPAVFGFRWNTVGIRCKLFSFLRKITVGLPAG